MEDFVWIDDYGKSLSEKWKENNEKYNEELLMIIRERRLKKLIQTEIKQCVKEKQISSDLAYKLECNMSIILRRTQIIYTQYRSDNKWGRAAVNYPVFSLHHADEYCGLYEYDTEKCIYNVYFESVIQMNVEHPCIAVLKERMENIDALMSFDSNAYD